MDRRIASGGFEPRVPPGRLAWREAPAGDRRALRMALKQARLAKPRNTLMAHDEARLALLAKALRALAAAAPTRLCVTGFMAIHGELDLQPLRQSLVELDWWLPCTTPRGEPLRWGRWPMEPPEQAPQAWRTGAYNILEPAEQAEPVPQVVLVPLLGFSPSCHRLGYGAGYYDRTLAAWRAQGLNPLALGIAESGAACSEALLAPLPTDQPLHAVLCEQGWWLPS